MISLAIRLLVAGLLAWFYRTDDLLLIMCALLVIDVLLTLYVRWQNAMPPPREPPRWPAGGQVPLQRRSEQCPPMPDEKPLR